MLTTMLNYAQSYGVACWAMLVEMAPYMLLGFLIAGALHIFVNPQIIVKYLGRGRISSVVYAALFGIPLPLCSCGVLPTAVSLKKQGANSGATLAFLIATPETGVDSMAVTYALLDPIMTVFRPVAAFITAITAGIVENFFGHVYQEQPVVVQPDLACQIDHCCDGADCPPDLHRRHHSLTEKLVAGIRYGFGEILDDLAGWLTFGLAIAALITVAVPADFFKTYLHGGVFSMLTMLFVGIPLYICATASTPIAAAFILKGMSPGAALVFLLAGPATNAATIAVVWGVFGKRATALYLSSIAVCAVVMGLLLDGLYAWLNISAETVAGSAAAELLGWVPRQV